MRDVFRSKMENFYYELFFRVEERYKDLFFGFVFDLGVEAIEESDGGAYIRSNDDLEELSWALELLAQRLSDPGVILEKVLVKKENQDWIKEYRRGVEPVLVDKVYVHTTWQEPKKGYLSVQIDPALAFGSGHHESTHSCIRLLQRFAKKGMKVLDLGCGSGILGIILAKLGCEVDVCDTDELAVDSALSNARLNQVEFRNVWKGSLEKTKNKYELIVANIVADVILVLERDIKRHLKEGAALILSGILDRYEMRVREKFQNLELVDSVRFNEWISLVYKRGNDDERSK